MRDYIIEINGIRKVYPNQDDPKNIMTPEVLRFVLSHYLPVLTQIHKAIELSTGHQWRPTSYIRQSPSHKNGSALDLAPDISPSSTPYYAAFNRSDPVLYARAPLINQLNRAAMLLRIPYKWGIYVENDHLHIGLFKTNLSGLNKGEVILWGSPKWVYPDTDQRMLSFNQDYKSIVKSNV